MNAKTLLFVAAIAASCNTFAAGRDSVSGQGVTVMSSKTSVSVQGRSGMYARNALTPMQSSRQAAMAVSKFGRA